MAVDLTAYLLLVDGKSVALITLSYKQFWYETWKAHMQYDLLQKRSIVGDSMIHNSWYVDVANTLD